MRPNIRLFRSQQALKIGLRSPSSVLYTSEAAFTAATDLIELETKDPPRLS